MRGGGYDVASTLSLSLALDVADFVVFESKSSCSLYQITEDISSSAGKMALKEAQMLPNARHLRFAANRMGDTKQGDT